MELEIRLRVNRLTFTLVRMQPPVPLRQPVLSGAHPRRHFLIAGSLGVSSLCLQGCFAPRAAVASAKGTLFFVSQGRTCRIQADGSGFQVLEWNEPNQVTWQPTGFFPDGRRVLCLSMEARRDGPGKPFEEYYTQTPTHIWAYDMPTRQLVELCTKDRMAPFQTPALLIGSDRLLVQVVKDKVGQIWNMRLDGSDAREFTRAGEGFPYGLSLSPDGRRVAFHTAGPGPHSYRIWTSDVFGQNRQLVAGHPDHLYFGPTWSPDGQWLAWVDCLHREDPGHDWGDVCVGRPDGSEVRQVTSGQRHWFGATYGNPARRGGGSNILEWTRDGRLLYTRKQPGSKVPWEYQANRPDTDHFNRDWKPDSARGGTQICALDPATGTIEELTAAEPLRWDLRSVASPDGRHIAFCRCGVGESPSLWLMGRHGESPRELTRGIEAQGADHPRWVPSVH